MRQQQQQELQQLKQQLHQLQQQQKDQVQHASVAQPRDPVAEALNFFESQTGQEPTLDASQTQTNLLGAGEASPATSAEGEQHAAASMASEASRNVPAALQASEAQQLYAATSPDAPTEPVALVASTSDIGADFEDHPRARQSARAKVATDNSAPSEDNAAAGTQQMSQYAITQARRAQALAQQYQSTVALQEQRRRDAERMLVARRQAAMQAQLQKLHEEQESLKLLEQSLTQNLSAAASVGRQVPQGVATQRASGWPASFLHRAGAAQPFADHSGRFTSRPQALAQTARAPQGQEYAPDHAQCTPKCSYQCTNPTCEEVCDPVCESPKCQTRCSGADLSACLMQCGQPHCAVVCPKRPCAGPGCPACQTQCSQPMCMLQCPKAQPCHNVCEHPKCEWKCRAPDVCPKPECKMSCETPSTCMGSSFEQLPPLRQGEMLVQSFAAPASASRSSEATAAAALGGASLRGASSEESGAAAASAATPEETNTLTVPVYVGGDTSASQSQDGFAQQPWMVQMPAVTMAGN